MAQNKLLLSNNYKKYYIYLTLRHLRHKKQNISIS